jgi:hypothetical protein
VTRDDRPAFDVQMQRLGAAFTPLSEGAIEAYFHALDDLSIEQVCIAVGRAVSELRSRPVPAVLRELVLGTAEQREALAWSATKHLVALPRLRDFTLCICDALFIAVAVEDLGGWDVLERRIALDFTRQQFLAIYRDLVYRERHDLLGVSTDEMRRMRRSVANERHRAGLMALPVPQTLVDAGAVDPVRSKELTPDREAEQIDNLRTILAAAGRGGFG